MVPSPEELAFYWGNQYRSESKEHIFLFLKCNDCSAEWESSSIPLYVKETLSPRDFLANNCPWFYWIIMYVQINV